MRNAFTISLVVGVLVGSACGSPDGTTVPNDLEGFGKVRRGFLIPCTTDGQPTAFAVVEGRGRCVDNVGDLFPPLSQPTCETWIQVVPPDADCRTSVSAEDWELLSFVLDPPADTADFEGATAPALSITPCDGGDPESVVPDVLDATVVVTADDGFEVDVAIESERATGLLQLEVCRQ